MVKLRLSALWLPAALPPTEVGGCAVRENPSSGLRAWGGIALTDKAAGW